MASYTNMLHEKSLIHPPKWLVNNVMFEGMTGSVAYGINNDTSDMDIVGFCMPPKETIFPHLRGEILGFGTPGERFDQFLQHGIVVPEHSKTYDFTIYGIVKFFQLVMENNPNCLELLYLPRRCILHTTQIYEKIRNERSLFLHKGSYHKHRGYVHAQMAKVRNKTNASNPKRAALIEKFGYDTKFAAHSVRLSLQCEQIMMEGTLDLDCNSKFLKSIREGEWSLEKIDEWLDEKEKQMENLYTTSPLQHSPDQNKIRDLLLECIEMHYGKISTTITRETNMNALIADIKAVMEKYE